jgi:segregation and condensation protein A
MSELDDLAFEEAEVAAPVDDGETLKIDIDGWEGPLDLLLTLARSQKVDLRQISILQLVEQYLGFIENARALKLELAADYLVMAAWLTYLKSALLLPKDPEIEPSPEELALRLQLRLERLNAMRESGARLMARDRIGRDIFLRGEPEGLRVVRKNVWDCSYFDLITAYGQIHARNEPVLHVVKKRAVMTLEEALDRVSAMVGAALDWTQLETFLPPDAGFALRKSALASSFAAVLELAKRGKIDLQQDGSFAPLLLRAKAQIGASGGGL